MLKIKSLCLHFCALSPPMSRVPLIPQTGLAKPVVRSFLLVRKNSYIKPYWHISALMASRRKRSGRAKVPILVLL